MVLFNYSTRELTAKIVYYGPGLCGKTTNLQYIHANLPGDVKGRMLSLATKTDRTLFFDFLPIDLGEIRGMKTRVQLYTTPGQVFYNETRKLVLKGADGIVFVADSQEQMMAANVESFRNLEDNLRGHGMRLQDMPHVIQFNKRDLPNLASIEEINAAINRYNAPFYESVATTGIGVQDTLKAVVKLVLLHLTRKYEAKPETHAATPGGERAPRPASVVVPLAAQRSPLAERGQPLLAADAPASAAASLGLQGASETRVAEPRRPIPPPPDPRRVRDGAAVDETGGLSFESREIDDLVGDIEGYDETSPATDDIDWTPLKHEPIEASAAVDEVPIEIIEEETPLGAKAVAPEPPEPPRRVEPQFEVDRGFDPSWQTERDGEGEQSLAGGNFAEEVVPLAAVPHDSREPIVERLDARDAPGDLPPAATPIPVRLTEPPQESAADTTVVLEEVAKPQDLFEDPGLDVARLRAGEAREILVPVEIVEGAAVRRFKLSVRLRLDPLD
jgi:mutual gliding-motility protein MglA